VPGALTCLKLYLRVEVTPSDMDALARLSRLTTLALIADLSGRHGKTVAPLARWGLCMEAVRKLPVLEEASLGEREWSEEEVRRLLPPPERLKRLQLYAPLAYFAALPAKLDAVIRRLETLDVDVVIVKSLERRVASTPLYS
jgi:hypothetical protein